MTESKAPAPDVAGTGTQLSDQTDPTSVAVNDLSVPELLAGVGTLTAALAYAEYGLHVFPVDHPSQPGCIGAHKPEDPCDGKRGKHPAVAWKTWAATNTPQMIRDAWAKRGGLCNIGIACGPSALVVLDEDEQGALQRWCDARGITLPPTYTVDTGRGRHYYFTWDHEVQRNRQPGESFHRLQDQRAR